jgi:hypothetical protein
MTVMVSLSKKPSHERLSVTLAPNGVVDGNH